MANLPTHSAGFRDCLMFLVVVCILSCKKAPVSDLNKQADYSTQQLPVVQTGVADVYLAGWRSAYPNFEFADVWKDTVILRTVRGILRQMPLPYQGILYMQGETIL